MNPIYPILTPEITLTTEITYESYEYIVRIRSWKQSKLSDVINQAVKFLYLHECDQQRQKEAG